jgi:hypothetical protein
MMSSATAEVTPIFASNGASVTSRSSRYSSSATNRRAGWARMNRRLTQPTWRWYCSKTSIPNGASTHRKRAARRNCKPIKDGPTKPNATEKSIRKPLPGSIPDQARTSGAMATPRCTRIRNAPPTTRFAALSRVSHKPGERAAVLLSALPLRSRFFPASTRGSARVTLSFLKRAPYFLARRRT